MQITEKYYSRTLIYFNDSHVQIKAATKEQLFKAQFLPILMRSLNDGSILQSTVHGIM